LALLPDRAPATAEAWCTPSLASGAKTVAMVSEGREE
jgi:hypothetical protein